MFISDLNDTIQLRIHVSCVASCVVDLKFARQEKAMACSSSFWYYGLVLVCICFESLNSTPVQSALPSVNQHSKRQSYTCWGRLQTVPGPYSQCYCGVQINSVRTECCDGVSCRTIYSSVQRRSCVQNCPAGLQSGIAGSISVSRLFSHDQCSIHVLH